MITVKSLAKSFGDVHAIKDVSFTSNDSAITTLLGANGSGKTTTFRAICGLMAPDRGGAYIDEVSVQESPLQAQAKLGIFPDNLGLYTRLTCREHLVYFGELHGMERPLLNRRIQEVSDLLEIDDIMERRTEGFSQGQRMKVALARCLIHDPQNLVLDEPARGLDVMSIRLLRKILLDMKASGRCILLSSHVMAEVEQLSDKVVIISGGLAIAEGTPAELVRTAGAKNLEDAFIWYLERSEEISRGAGV